MNPYLFTVAFLLLMGLLTSSEVVRFSQRSLEQKCYLSSRSLLATTEELREWTHLEELRGEEPPPKPPAETRPEIPPQPRNSKTKRIAPLRINTARPPDNSRLNLYRLFNESDADKAPEHFSFYEVIAQLMRDLYGEEPYFQELSDMEYLILDQMMDNREQMAWTTPDQLSSMKIENQKIHTALYFMLKGNKHAPSLLNFLTYDPIDSPNKQSRKLNFLFADPHIIHALFPTGGTADLLLARREILWDAILDQEKNRLKRERIECKGRSEWNTEIKLLLEETLTSEGLDAKKYLTHVFDYGLSEPGTLLFTQDPLTGATLREKYIPQLPSPQ